MTMLAEKHYSVRETYWITHQAVRTLRFMGRSRVGRDHQFRERIMLAVTEVNGCELCSFAHARFALAAGLSEEEVRHLLGGVAEGVPDDQLPALVFAQHYADSRGHPDVGVWQELVDVYGGADALGVLGAVRVMMWGNAVGIPWSALRSRLMGIPDPGSSRRYELATIVGSTVVTPVALVHALVSELRNVPIVPGQTDPRCSTTRTRAAPTG